jgi:hypothetical protein
MMNVPYTFEFHVLESVMSPVKPGDPGPDRPADRPPQPGGGDIEIHILESPMYPVLTSVESLVKLTELVGLTRVRIPTMTPTELETFRSQALPQLEELQRLLTSGSPSA